ncbi:putative ribonuclease H-like domain-containing protein [Tanacetum coccineum]
MTFNQYKDAKTLFAAIQTRFSGNEATKKTQKTLLKQMYENFSAPSTESLDSNFNRLQEDLSTNEVNTAYGVSTANTQVSPASTQVSMLGDKAGYDKSKVKCFNCHKLGHFTRECKGSGNQNSKNRNQDSSRRTINVEETSSKAMLAIDGASFDWSYMADDEFPTNMALMAFLDSELEKLKQEKESNQLKIENFENASKSLDKLIGSRIIDKIKKGVGFVSYNVVPPPPTGLFSPPKFDLSNSSLEEFQQPKFEGYGPKPSKSVSEDTSIEVRESSDAPLVKELMSDDKPKAVNTARPNSAVVNAVKANQGHPQKEDQGYVDSGCSRHMQRTCPISQTSRNLMDDMLPLGEEPNEGKLLYMLADSKLPTTFWAEAVNTTCYGQNRVLIVKPHNKTPYELFRGRTRALSFMRPFGCHVTILNTLDYLGKFDGKSDEGFFVGYSLNSKDFRVYNIRTRKVEENLHIRFLEDNPIIAGDGPKWMFDIDVLTKSINYAPVVAGTNFNNSVDGLLFDSSSKNASNDEPQLSSDAEKKDDKGVNKESGIDDQERPKNSTQDVNTVGPSINTASTNVNTGSLNINIVSPTVTTAPLEATHADFFGDETEIDMSNITTTYLVPSTPNTRIHKDHLLDHVISDVQSGVLTRRMIKTTNEQGFISAVYEGKTHEDLYTCLFACFLSQEEPKKFKLQHVWTLVDLPHGKRAIGTKWVYMNKKYERGVVIRNKARLVAQGYTQEEGIDYDEVFAPVARIEAIRLFLAYASFKDFVVYQMDVKSTFLYGKIEKEVYVCQPLGFEDPEFPDRVYKVEKALYGLHQAPRAWYETLSTYLLDNRF